jgi:2-C-methyl-D-erythritol 4-phosphate cytidylyltransferase
VSQIDVDVIAVGRVLDEGRGSLPYALVHGEALVAAATWGLSEAGVMALDARTSVEGVLDSELPLVLHDALCPMTPPAFIESCVRRAVEADVVVAGVRPVTDTVKVLNGEVVGATVDRESLVRVVSPVVVPASRVDGVCADASTDLADLVAALSAEGQVVLLEAPPEAMRVASSEDLRVLEALTRPTV